MYRLCSLWEALAVVEEGLALEFTPKLEPFLFHLLSG